MYRIDNASAVPVKPNPPPAGTPGYFTNGNPAQALEATIVDDWWANSIQEEILTVIEQAGIVPDKTKTTQLFDALNLLFLQGSTLDDTYLTIAGWRGWSAPILTSGTATAYTVTYARDPGPLVDGMIHLLEFHTANGALATANVNNKGSKPIVYYSVSAWRQIPPNLLGPNQIHPVAYHAGSDSYRLVEWEDTTGDYIPTGRALSRVGTILGLGQAVSRIEYAGLFAAYGITYGQGNGSTTFNLPDLRGRVVAGTDQGAGRLNGVAVAGTLGSFGGVETQQYNITGTAASAPISGTVNASGSAATAGMAVSGSGYTGAADSNTQGQGGGGFTAATQYHGHPFSFSGTITGNATVTVSGTLAGWTGGGSISGTTDVKSNMPPVIVGNYAICL